MPNDAPPAPTSARRPALQRLAALERFAPWLLGAEGVLLLAIVLFPGAARPLAVGALAALGLGVLAARQGRQRAQQAARALILQVGELRDGNFSAETSLTGTGAAPAELSQLAREIDTMKVEFGRRFAEFNRANQRSERLLEEVIPIGVELMAEKDFNGLLERILRLAQSFCGADGGTLYLKTEDNRLRFEIIHTDSLGVSLGGTSGQAIAFPHLPLYTAETGEPNFNLLATYVALTGETYNFPGGSGTGRFHEQVRQSVLYDNYRIHSMLTIPLKNTNREVLGVMQLINAQDPNTRQHIPFDRGIQRWMESFAFLSVAALEAYIREQQLKKEIEHLRFEVDEAKRERQVEEIVESDYFKRISAHAAEMRKRKKAG